MLGHNGHKEDTKYTTHKVHTHFKYINLCGRRVFFVPFVTLLIFNFQKLLKIV